MTKADRDAIATLKTNTVTELQTARDNTEVNGDIANAVNDLDSDLHPAS